jgi:hypothetical protein
VSDSAQISTRRAALMLHAMQPVDCAWVLRNIPTGQSARLRTLLEELRSLGIPADPSLLTEPIKAQHKSPPGEEEKSAGFENHAAARPDDFRESPGEHSLDVAHVDVLLAILKQESAALVARLLSVRAWKWRDGLLQAMSAEQRRAVHQCMERHTTARLSSGVENAALLQHALIDGLSKRYTQAAASRQHGSSFGGESSPHDPDTSMRTGFSQVLGVWRKRIALRWRNWPITEGARR